MTHDQDEASLDRVVANLHKMREAQVEKGETTSHQARVELLLHAQLEVLRKTYQWTRSNTHGG